MKPLKHIGEKGDSNERTRTGKHHYSFTLEQIVIMSARPGEIQEIITTDKYSRMNRGSSGFAAYKKKIYGHFFQDSAEFLQEAEYMI